jgi:low affinity Fe/Cu permease
MNDFFRKFAHKISEIAGSPAAFIAALGIILVWASYGPSFNFSEIWHLMINTATTITTFLIVFLIQNTQNRDAKAIHLKLDELLRVSKPARDNLVDLEDFSDEELNKLENEFRHIHQVAEQARAVAERRKKKQDRQ